MATAESDPPDNEQTSDPAEPDLWGGPARDYLLLGLAALAVSALTLIACGARGMAMIPNLFGALGLGFRTRMAPVLYIGSLAIILLNPLSRITGQFIAASPLTDLLLTASTLTYLLAQYRLLSLTDWSLPPDPRRPLHGAKKPAAPLRRPASSVPATELPYGLLAVLVFALAPPALWSLANLGPSPLRIDANVVRLTALAWVVGSVLASARIVLRAWAWRKQSPVEARLYLVDLFWRETRRDQARIWRR